MTATHQPEAKSSSRRALLAGALGGLGALAASAIGRASPTRATDGDTIHVGDSLTAASSTTLTNNTTALAIFSANSTSGFGLYGSSSSTYGVVGISTSSHGIHGVSTSNSGVYGQSDSGSGVQGSSNTGIGVHGMSTANVGVLAESSGYDAIWGISTDGVGVDARSTNHMALTASSSATSQPAIRGSATGNNTGVLGASGTIPSPKAKTGVYGYAAQDSTSKGIYGESPAGWAGYFLGRLYLSKYQEMAEVSTPSAPGTNKARLFVRDNGSGKTQLCVRFNTGAIRVLATQA